VLLWLRNYTADLKSAHAQILFGKLVGLGMRLVECMIKYFSRQMQYQWEICYSQDVHHTISVTIIIPLQMWIVQLKLADAQLDLVLMGKADIFIGNCISSFSAFVKRERTQTNCPLSFSG